MGGILNYQTEILRYGTLVIAVFACGYFAQFLSRSRKDWDISDGLLLVLAGLTIAAAAFGLLLRHGKTWWVPGGVSIALCLVFAGFWLYSYRNYYITKDVIYLVISLLIGAAVGYGFFSSQTPAWFWWALGGVGVILFLVALGLFLARLGKFGGKKDVIFLVVSLLVICAAVFGFVRSAPPGWSWWVLGGVGAFIFLVGWLQDLSGCMEHLLGALVLLPFGAVVMLGIATHSFWVGLLAFAALACGVIAAIKVGGMEGVTFNPVVVIVLDLGMLGLLMFALKMANYQGGGWWIPIFLLAALLFLIVSMAFFLNGKWEWGVLFLIIALIVAVYAFAPQVFPEVVPKPEVRVYIPIA